MHYKLQSLMLIVPLVQHNYRAISHLVWFIFIFQVKLSVNFTGSAGFETLHLRRKKFE